MKKGLKKLALGISMLAMPLLQNPANSMTNSQFNMVKDAFTGCVIANYDKTLNPSTKNKRIVEQKCSKFNDLSAKVGLTDLEKEFEKRGYLFKKSKTKHKGKNLYSYIIGKKTREPGFFEGTNVPFYLINEDVEPFFTYRDNSKFAMTHQEGGIARYVVIGINETNRISREIQRNRRPLAKNYQDCIDGKPISDSKTSRLCNIEDALLYKIHVGKSSKGIPYRHAKADVDRLLAHEETHVRKKLFYGSIMYKELEPSLAGDNFLGLRDLVRTSKSNANFEMGYVTNKILRCINGLPWINNNRHNYVRQSKNQLKKGFEICRKKLVRESYRRK